MYEYKALVIRVIDGDTLDVDIDLGLDIRQKTRLRLFGIDAAERATELGKYAKLDLEVMFADNPNVIVQTKKDKTEKYGRYLAVVLLPSGIVLNDWLLEKGYAKPMGA
jgi:micrococcal nuclease